MISKINITEIIVDHLDTLRHGHNNKRSGTDFVLFYGVPLLVAGAIIWFKGSFGKSIGGVLITSFSVFAALLFNLLLLVYDIVRKSGNDSNMSGIRAKVLKQLYSNISYSIFIAIAIIIMLLGYFVALSLARASIVLALAFLVYTFSTNFILTILMVLKRVHKLLTQEFENVNRRP